MEVVYNVTYKYKSKEILTKDEIKEIFNRKLINIILNMENQDLKNA